MFFQELLEAQFGAERIVLEQLLEKHRGESGINRFEADQVLEIAADANGVPSRLGWWRDSDEVMSRARVVRNTVEIDPEAPTLSEVREMIDEAVREGREEEQAESL